MTTHVLVVDDDDTIRELMDMSLTQAGYRVTTASSPEAAMDLLSRLCFAVVLLDIAMPRISGLDVLSFVRRRTNAPPVLMVSAKADKATVMEAAARGCVGFLAKPFQPRDLNRRVALALRPREQLAFDLD